MRLFAPRSYHHHSSIATAASLLLFPSLVSAFVARPSTTPTKMMPSSPASVRRSLTSVRAVAISDVLKSPKWPEEPFFRPTDFDRQDESSDSRYIDVYVCRRACVGVRVRV